ncbi:MAG TPA: HAD hydrolase-like protein [Vitreimonas sp.]|nr:HAD hydrolase-like protein [Vitreimonas sp.]
MNEHQAVILFDIDRTLFDTPYWAGELVNPAIAELLNVKVEELLVVKNQYTDQLVKNTDFNPVDYLTHLSKVYARSIEELAQVFYQPAYFQQAVYADVLPTLLVLRSQYQLGIFSEGDLDFQQTKLELSGLKSFFEPELHFIERRKEVPQVLQRLQPGWVIVEDKPEVITTLETQTQTLPIWINREAETEFTPQRQMTTLTELPELASQLLSAL